MKAEFTAEGILVVSPESPIEAFALRYWVGANHVTHIDADPSAPTRQTFNADGLIIHTEIPQEG